MVFFQTEGGAAPEMSCDPKWAPAVPVPLWLAPVLTDAGPSSPSICVTVDDGVAQTHTKTERQQGHEWSIAEQPGQIRHWRSLMQQLALALHCRSVAVITSRLQRVCMWPFLCGTYIYVWVRETAVLLLHRSDFQSQRDNGARR